MVTSKLLKCHSKAKSRAALFTSAELIHMCTALSLFRLMYRFG